MDQIVYLDNNATTRVDPEVLATMLPYFSEEYGNASSRNHAMGDYAAKSVEKAREQIASLINCDTKEVIFTSGATESNNLVFRGVLEAREKKADT